MHSQFMPANAKTEVPMIGPKAFPANLPEFKKPMVFPLKSAAKKEIVSGIMAAIIAV